MFKSVQISGSFGPNAVVEAEGKRAINIAGGSISGDFYREVLNEQVPTEKNEEDYLSKLKGLINGMASPLKDQLSSAIQILETGDKSCESADVVSLMDLVLTRLKPESPEAFRLLAQAIVQRLDLPSMRRMALNKISDIEGSIYHQWRDKEA